MKYKEGDLVRIVSCNVNPSFVGRNGVVVKALQADVPLYKVMVSGETISDYATEDCLETLTANSIWHPMSECPIKGKVILVQTKDTFYGVSVQKGGTTYKNRNKDRYVRWAYIDDILNLSNVGITVKNWKEPVSESIDFEQELYKAFGQIKDFTLGVAIAKRFYDMGRKHNEPVSEQNLSNVERIRKDWKEEPVSEELEDAAIRASMLKHDIPKEHLHEYLYNDYGMRKFVEGAKWQEEKDDEEKVLTYKHGFEDCKEQMMANATEVTVHIDAGGYSYIPQIELYDYDNDVPLAKEGDKYKVVLIKK